MLRRLTSHMLSLDLMVPVQSAYRANHSTETVLLRVMNDLLLAVDNGDGAALVLFDLSAAFDTIDHTVHCEAAGVYSYYKLVLIRHVNLIISCKNIYRKKVAREKKRR